jgi:hypothetical protein
MKLFTPIVFIFSRICFVPIGGIEPLNKTVWDF